MRIILLPCGRFPDFVSTAIKKAPQGVNLTGPKGSSKHWVKAASKSTEINLNVPFYSYTFEGFYIHAREHVCNFG